MFTDVQLENAAVSFLQDVLKSDVDLDGMFKLSFAYDIVNVSQFIWQHVNVMMLRWERHFKPYNQPQVSQMYSGIVENNKVVKRILHKR